MAGTTGNLAWAEDGSEPVLEPADGYKATGYAYGDIPTAENLNWTLQRLGRASVRRFDDPAELVAARRSGTGGGAPNELPETLGVIMDASPGTVPLGTIWNNAGTANDATLHSDGSALWVGDVAGGISKRSLVDGSLLLSGPFDGVGAPLATVSTRIASAGGAVYAMKTSGGTRWLSAFDRDTLWELYSVDTGVPAVVNIYDVATDGQYVTVAMADTVYIYQDTGAALVASGNWAKGGGSIVRALRMDGRYVITGGTASVVVAPFDHIVVLDYAMNPVATLSRTAYGIPENPAGSDTINRIWWDGRRILYVSGDPDSAGNYAGCFESIYSTTECWQLQEYAHDGAIIDVGINGSSGGPLAVMACDDGNLKFYRIASGGRIAIVDWDFAGAQVPLRLSWDYDGIYVFGNVTAAGIRLGRYSLTPGQRLYVPLPASDTRFRAIPSALIPAEVR